MTTKRHGMQMADGAINSYSDQIAEFKTELQEIARNRGSIAAELEQSLENLAIGLLPDCSTETVRAAAADCGALHLEEALENLTIQRDDASARITEIEADQRFIDREMLTHPTTGDYSVRINEHQGYVDGLQESLRPYDFREFHWLRSRGVHTDRDFGTFDRFWRAITFSNAREQKAVEVAMNKLQISDIREGVEEYDSISENLSEHQTEVDRWTGLRDEVFSLVDEHTERTNFVTNFEDAATESLRGELSEHLKYCNMKLIHDQVRPQARMMTSKCDALTEKLKYMDNMSLFLRNEISDREKRIHSIDRVRHKWSRKPYGPLYGDKSKWLVTVPEMKRQSTRKRSRWIRTMNHNIYHYDHYDRYDALMCASIGFLAYDAFAYRAEERMPYEGFTRTVIDDLDEFRVENDMEKADYAGFDEAFNEYEQPIEEEIIDGEFVDEEIDPEEIDDFMEEMLEGQEEDTEAFNDEADMDEEMAAEALADEMEGEDCDTFEDAS